MNLSSAGITYLFLVIPTLLAITVLAQGVSKVRRKDKGGGTVFGFGVAFLLLVAGVYYFVIQ